ncbi:MAG: flagellin [Verrucomicrobiia bacterium]
MVINTNIQAQTSARLLGDSSSRLSQSLARLSSGSKIVSPADDAAGLAVSTRFDAQINRTGAAINNLGNTLSFCQTQDGYMNKIGKALDRMSELAMLAQDVTKTDSDRSLYNREFQTLNNYVNSIATKDFNGVTLFSSSALNVTIDTEGVTLQMAGISGTYLTANTTVGYAGTTLLSELTSKFTDNTGSYDFYLDSGSVKFSASSTINDLVNYFNSGSTSASYDSTTGELSITVASGDPLDDWAHWLTDLGLTPDSTVGGYDRYNGPQTLTATLTDPTPVVDPGVSDISTASGAAAALTTVKSAINQLATDRATVGATIARLNSTSESLGTLKENLAAANSRIKDVDVAEESTQFARYNILVQSGTAMLAQANATPNSVLKLLS